jgi:copper chaperone NosL
MLKKSWEMIVCLWLVVCLSAAAQAADNYLPQPIKQEQRCPVCGMYPAQYPKWHAQIVFKDGTQSAFDSAADMFRFLDGMALYDQKHTATDIGNIYVPDYAKGGWINARKAFFVEGSNVMGPMMSNDLPAFGSKDDAMLFIRKSGGRVLSFEQITTAVVKGLRGHTHDENVQHGY